MAAADAIVLLNQGTAAWAAGMARACVSGGLWIFLVWMVCRSLPRLSAWLRAMLWWLACAKLVGTLLCAAAISVPVLPTRLAPLLLAANPPALTRATVSESHEASAMNVDEVVGDAEAPGEWADAVATNPARAHVSWPHTLPAALWEMGFLALLGVRAKEAISLRRRLRTARSLAGTNAERELQRLCGAMKRRRPPRLVEASFASAPFVTGALRPCVVLPRGFAESVSPSDLRMALAHELAHIRRGDLWLGLLPALAQAAFFFFPPVWLAIREYAAAREEDCDAAAIRATGTEARRYGALLVRLAAQGAGRVGGAAGLGMASGNAARFRQIRRRLACLRQFASRPSRGQRMAAVLLVVPCLIAGLPWRVTARNAAPSLSNLAETDATLPRYTLTDLGTLGGNNSYAYALNDRGQVVGGANASAARDPGRAFLWSDGRMANLGVLARTRRSLALDVNNAGIVIAASYNGSRFPHAFLAAGEGGKRYLAPLPGHRFSRPRAINDRGQVVGSAQTGGSERGALVARAFLWDPKRGSAPQDLGTLGGRFSHAFGLNNAGVVVGKADVGPGATHAFSWQNGAMQDLGTLPGGRNSLALGVNERGDVVGFSQTPDGERAALWTNEAVQNLGTLPGERDSVARAINNAGQVVGQSGQRAVLWSDGRLLDLNRLLPPGSDWVLEDARAINASGWIVGQARVHGRSRAFLLTPADVPR